MNLDKSTTTNQRAYSLNLNNQTKLVLTGVDEIISTNEHEIVAKSGGKRLLITGSNINITKLVVETGDLEATGIFDSMKYSGGKNVGLLKRIFK